MFGSFFYDFLFFAIPAMILTLFVVSLCRYIHARKQNKKSPDSFGKEEINKREMYLVFFSVVLGALVLVVVGFTVLLFSAVAFM